MPGTAVCKGENEHPDSFLAGSRARDAVGLCSSPTVDVRAEALRAAPQNELVCGQDLANRVYF